VADDCSDVEPEIMKCTAIVRVQMKGNDRM